MDENRANKGTSKLTIELIVIGIVIFALVFIFLSNTGDRELAAAAVNAKKPLGEVMSALMSRYF